MKNYWADEREVKIMAELISAHLQLNFEMRKANMEDWGLFALDMMKDCSQRVRDALMWKYTFKWELDAEERVTVLQFVKLPWLI
jgi:hypothetical protein